MDFRTNKKTKKKYPINARDKDKNKLNLDPKKLDELTDKLTKIVMEERRKNILDDPKKARPQYMRTDVTTPLIREVPFGPDTRAIENLAHNEPNEKAQREQALAKFLKTDDISELHKILQAKNRGNYDHISQHNMSEFDKFEAEQNALPKDKQFPSFGDVTGQGSDMQMNDKGNEVNANSFRVIPHGGISIPKEQERIVRTREQRNWEHGKLKARSNKSQQSDKDAEEIAKELLLNEGSSRFVNKVTGKIRPNKPVRSDYASIISAEKGFNGIVKKETTFKVAEHDKPEFVSVVPLPNWYDEQIKKVKSQGLPMNREMLDHIKFLERERDKS